jgi:methylglutaconyl-CoA hydratase
MSESTIKNPHTKIRFTSMPGGERVATLVLNRPDQANAFSAQMMEEITSHAASLKTQKDVRILVITGAGKHFSAGADLGWMQASAKLSFEENIRDAERLRAMFESLATLEIPKVAAVSGAVYGGAVGLVACCDFAVASPSAKFCLSEAKLGLLPAVIAPYLMRKMKAGQLRRLALTGAVFSGAEAKEYGLLEVISGENPGDLDLAVHKEINGLLGCGPAAQKSILSLFDTLRTKNHAQCDDTVQAISKARTGAEGQAGLGSFFSKEAPPWARSLTQFKLTLTELD